MFTVRSLTKWRSLFPFHSACFILTNYNCAQKVGTRLFNFSSNRIVAARSASTSQSIAPFMPGNDDGISRGFDEKKKEKHSKQRNFFEGESTNARDIPMISAEHFDKTCRLLLNKDQSKANIVPLNFLYRMPAASLNYEKSQFFIEHVLTSWWRTFARHLESPDINPTPEKYFSRSQLAVVLNSLTKLNKESEGKIVRQLGWERLQMLTDAIFEKSSDLPYRSVAMILRNVYILISRYKDEELFPQIDSTAASWSPAKLNRFMLKFYDSLRDYDAKTDPQSYLNIEEAFMVMFFASKLGLESPCNKNLPKSEEICAALAKLFVEFSSPNFLSDSHTTRLIQLTKLMQLCVDWQFDIELFCPDGKQHSAFWSSIFEQVAALLARTSATADGDVCRVIFRTRVCQLGLIAACKFGRERQFAVQMRRAWSDTMGPKTLNRAKLSALIEHVRQSPNCQKAAHKYSDFGCYQRLFEVLLH